MLHYLSFCTLLLPEASGCAWVSEICWTIITSFSYVFIARLAPHPTHNNMAKVGPSQISGNLEIWDLKSGNWGSKQIKNIKIEIRDTHILKIQRIHLQVAKDATTRKTYVCCFIVFCPFLTLGCEGTSNAVPVMQKE